MNNKAWSDYYTRICRFVKQHMIYIVWVKRHQEWESTKIIQNKSVVMKQHHKSEITLRNSERLESQSEWRAEWSFIRRNWITLRKSYRSKILMVGPASVL